MSPATAVNWSWILRSSLVCRTATRNYQTIPAGARTLLGTPVSVEVWITIQRMTNCIPSDVVPKITRVKSTNGNQTTGCGNAIQKFSHPLLFRGHKMFSSIILILILQSLLSGIQFNHFHYLYLKTHSPVLFPSQIYSQSSFHQNICHMHLHPHLLTPGTSNIFDTSRFLDKQFPTTIPAQGTSQSNSFHTNSYLVHHISLASYPLNLPPLLQWITVQNSHYAHSDHSKTYLSPWHSYRWPVHMHSQVLIFI